MQFVLPPSFGEKEITALISVNNNVPFITCLLQQADERKRRIIAALVGPSMFIDTIKLILPHIPPEIYKDEMDFLLAKATSVGAVDVVRFLLESGVSPQFNISHITSNSVLSNPDILDLFLQYGADVNNNSSGCTAIMCLKNIPHAITVMHKLLWHGADCRARDFGNSSVFARYVEHGGEENVDAIIAELYRHNLVSDEDILEARNLPTWPWNGYRKLHRINAAIGGNLFLTRYLSLVEDKAAEIQKIVQGDARPADTRSYLLSL